MTEHGQPGLTNPAGGPSSSCEPAQPVGVVGAFCPACGERVRPTDPHLQRDNVRWHLSCTTFRLSEEL